MQIWPAIDIRAGKCVRLRQGDYQQETIYGDDPAETAAGFVAEGATGLHIVDLDGAREGRPVNFDSIANLTGGLDLPVQLGGGIRDLKTLQRYDEIGVQRFIVGTRALNDPEWVDELTSNFPGRVVIGIDARDGMVATEGWMTGSQVAATEFASQISAYQIAGVVYTDIAKDGMLAGPNFEALEEMSATVHCPVIASGGITTVDDVARLAGMGLAGCIIGRALYDGQITLKAALAAAETGMSKI